MTWMIFDGLSVYYIGTLQEKQPYRHDACVFETADYLAIWADIGGNARRWQGKKWNAEHS